MSARPLLSAALAAALVAGLAGLAEARGGRGSDMGDSYLGDAQKNPRFIQPGGDYAYGRNRISHPSEGYYDRIWAQQGYAYPGQHPYRGRVVVRPYGY